MKGIKRICVSLLLLTGILQSLAAAEYLFKKLEARDGLTSSQINCILKDDRGYMWFGTPAGLYRYDGYTFRHFQSDSQDGSSLPDSYVESIQPSLAGDLWVKTPAGYCIYHPQTENFERDMRQIFGKLGMKNIPGIIYLDRHRNLWGYQAGKGVFCYDMQQQLLYEFGYTNDASGIPQGDICSIGECNDGVILVYTDGRLVCCDVMVKQRVVWKNQDIAMQRLRQSKTLRVYTDKKDIIWLYGQGTLFAYDRKLNLWDTHIGDQLGLTGNNVDNAVNAIYSDKNKNVWVATNRHGLMHVDAVSHVMEPVQFKSMSPMRRITENMGIKSVYVDNTGLLWVGTAKAGVAYIGNKIYKFQSELIGDITAIAQDASGKMWYGTGDNGVIDYEGTLASLKVTAMAYTNDGSLWVGSRQSGLTRIKEGSAHIYSTANDSIRKTLIDDHVNDLCSDKSSNLWIATDGGLQMYNTRMDQFSNYTKENGKIKTNSVTSLFYASRNRLLVGTSEGVFIMNISTGEMTHLVGNQSSVQKFTNNYITDVFEDSRKLLWIGTREGVNVLDMETDVLTQITEKIGLCNNNICGITEDKHHNIWVTTSNGVCRIVIQRDHEEGIFNYGLYNYDHNDGLQSDEFNPGSILTRNDGEVVMGGLYGINMVRPKVKGDSESLPQVILTQLFIGEEEILTGHEYDGNVPLTSALNEISHLTLKKSQNTFTIKFAGGNYNQSERLQFMYWMEGLDHDWKNGDALKHGVTFTDLPSRTYTLHVKAMNADGQVSDQERVIKITIERPWYLQWWSLIIYALLLAGTIYLWRKGWAQMKALWAKKHAILRELAVQREEIKAASDDLRQPMSRMTSIIMNLAELDSTPEEREQLNALHSQMLTVITRVSDMQSALEHPEEKAKQVVNKNFELGTISDQLSLPEMVEEELTSEIRPAQNDLPTAKFRIIFVDNNTEFIKFMNNRLRYIYDFHPYDEVKKALADIEVVQPDLIVCKQDMPDMTGSELCNQIKMHHMMNKIKFILMTDMKLSYNEMMNQNITLAADDYLAKPFNLQDAVMRINKLLGIGPIELDSNLIEGAETRMLEGRNSSMTTATESADFETANKHVDIDEELKTVSLVVRNHNMEETTDGFYAGSEHDDDSMAYNIDKQLIKSIEQYVQQNMSRGTINLEEMAAAMGMGMKPFFQKVRDITGKTPAEVVRDLRLKNACILLQRTNINMSELASNIGIPTAEHFINMFKERFGISPSEYRMKYRQ